MSWLAEYPLWIASYGAQPAIPAPWQSWTFWQYDGNNGERMPNGGDADFNRFNGDEAAFEAFCRRDPPPTEDQLEADSDRIIHPEIDFVELVQKR